MNKIAIAYGSSSGNAESVAKRLQEKIGGDLFNVDSVKPDELAAYPILILGTSTSGIGDLQDDWEDFLSGFLKLDFTGKKIAIFAVGDSSVFSGSFAGSMRVLYDSLQSKAQIVGAVEDKGYTYDASEGVLDGKWVGLPIDEENESDQTEERLTQWVEQLKKELA